MPSAAPVVTGDVNPAALDEQVRLRVNSTESTTPRMATAARAHPARDTIRAWEALEQVIIEKTIIFYCTRNGRLSCGYSIDLTRCEMWSTYLASVIADRPTLGRSLRGTTGSGKSGGPTPRARIGALVAVARPAPADPTTPAERNFSGRCCSTNRAPPQFNEPCSNLTFEHDLTHPSRLWTPKLPTQPVQILLVLKYPEQCHRQRARFKREPTYYQPHEAAELMEPTNSVRPLLAQRLLVTRGS